MADDKCPRCGTEMVEMKYTGTHALEKRHVVGGLNCRQHLDTCRIADLEQQLREAVGSCEDLDEEESDG